MSGPTVICGLLSICFVGLSLGDYLPLLRASRYSRELLHKLGEQVDNEYSSVEQKIEINHREKVVPSERNLARLNQDNVKDLFDGDMLLSTTLLEQIVQDGEKSRHTRQAFKDINYPNTIWSGGIPYQFDPKLPKKTIDSINLAMDFWEAETCINFRPRTLESQYVYYTGSEPGCFSTVGRDVSQPRQPVNIGIGCDKFGITTHEIAHAIGLFHHHQRLDRDGFVTLIKDNVDTPYLQNFAKISDRFLSTYDTPYDIGSVMHYTPTEFAKDRFRPALEAVDPNLQPTMGSMDKPSFLDVQLVNRHYKCAEVCANTAAPPVCLNGGYMNPRNCVVCKCPPGFGGPRCENVESSAPMPCGGVLPATNELQKMKIILKSGGERRQCVYQIRAPPTRRVMVGVERVKGQCQEGCYTSGMEVKMKGDFRPVGYRVCCESHSFRRLLSESNIAPLMFYTTNQTLEVSLFFRWVVDGPGAEDGTNAASNRLGEVFRQANSQFGVDMSVTGSKESSQVEKIENQKMSREGQTWTPEKYGSNGTSDVDFSVYKKETVE